jgi:hypothetical protein
MHETDDSNGLLMSAIKNKLQKNTIFVEIFLSHGM